MKKWLVRFFCFMLAVLVCCWPLFALAEDSGGGGGIDWTPIVVAVIGAVVTALSGLLARVWMAYVKPWLEQRGLNDAAKIVIDAVEALLGRYCGADKWKLALQKMEERGFNINSDMVTDALKAAWNDLNTKMIAAGIKSADETGVVADKPPDAAEENG